MCVVERKTYIHSNDRREVHERIRRCHHATRDSLCRYVERKEIEVARVVEARPSSSRNPPPDEIIIAGRDGRTQRYRTLVRRSSKRTSRRYSEANDRSPVDSVSGPSSPLKPTYREIRPPAPSPPPPTLPSPRRPGLISPVSPPDPNRTVQFDGTAIYSRPPSLEPRPRRLSLSSTTAEIDDPVDLAPPPPPLLSRRPSYRTRKPSKITIETIPPNSPALGTPSSPGLSSLPQIQTRTPRPQDPQEEAALLYQSQSRQPSSSTSKINISRQISAEKTQMARERANAEARKRSLPPIIHNPPPRNFTTADLLERGEAVIAQKRAQAAEERLLQEEMAGLDLEEPLNEIRRNPSRRLGEGRRERHSRRGRDQGGV